MNEELTKLREMLLSAPESGATRIVSIALSFVLIAVILWLVRGRRLREEYTPIWMLVAFLVTLLSVNFEWLRGLTRALGAWTPSSTIFFLGEVFLVTICLNYAVRLSKLNLQMKNLAQEVALLRAQVKENDKKPKDSTSGS